VCPVVDWSEGLCVVVTVYRGCKLAATVLVAVGEAGRGVPNPACALASYGAPVEGAE
jgi:hypothetical protein